MRAAALLSLAVPAAAFRLKTNQTQPSADCFESNPCPGVPAYVDPCSCRKFSEVYKSSSATCGDGEEYAFATHKTNPPLPMEVAVKYMKQGTCTEFYEKRDDNLCSNIDFEGSGKTWCYTYMGCTAASIEAVSYRMHAKIKACGSSDAKLADKSVSSLLFFATAGDLDAGMTAKMAYPVKHSIKWSEFKKTVLSKFCPTAKSKPERMPIQHKVESNQKLESALQAILGDSATPINLVEPDDNSAFGILTTTAIFEVVAVDPSVADHAHPATETVVNVLCGNPDR